jgi:glycosyltransferase involved in cell wall biosynthesis
MSEESKSCVVVVGRDVAGTIHQVIDALPPGIPVVFVDDGSVDGSSDKMPDRVSVVRHQGSRGYGGAQKSGYAWAVERGFERVALLHGDDQYNAEDVLCLLDILDDADIALGSRFLAYEGGYVIPWWRRWANRGLTGFANRVLGTEMTDGHTGARAYRAELLQRLNFASFSDNYLFDQQLIASAARLGATFGERPVRTRYDDDVQSISWVKSVQYGVGCVLEIVRG